MTENQLVNKELINLYALCKQIKMAFNKINIEGNKNYSLLLDIIHANTNDFELLTNIMDELELNPGNTKDSVAEEILENIQQIFKMKLTDAIKNKGILASVNRLLHYKIANLEIIHILGLKKQSVMIHESLEIIRNHQRKLIVAKLN